MDGQINKWRTGQMHELTNEHELMEILINGQMDGWILIN